MRPRKFDHFKGFNFYVVEDQPESSARKADGDDAEADGEKNDLDQWFEVRKNVLPPDEDEERNRENPTWKVSPALAFARAVADSCDSCRR